MKTSLITIRPKIADKKNNLQKMQNYIQKTKSDMYIFGELNLTGYQIKDEFRDLAEKANGPSIKTMKTTAKKHNCYIVFGMPIKDDKVEGLIHNSSVMIHPSGKTDIYNKWFMPTFGPFEEKIYYDEGESLTLCKTKFGKIGLTICYDIFFPELSRAYAMLGADMIINISATPNISKKYFETLIPARAVENTIFYTFVNIVGTQENLVFWGGSQISDPLAKQIIKAPYYKESIVTCEIDLEQIKTARANRPVLRDIRPEIYNDLYTISRTHKKPTKK